MVMGARLLRGCHGERADACSWWSWHGQQDDHKVRWTRYLTPEGTTDCQLPFFLLTGCSTGYRDELPVSISKLGGQEEEPSFRDTDPVLSVEVAQGETQREPDEGM